MKSNYKRLGPYIREINVRNAEDRKDNLLGVSTQKIFIDSIANTVGTNFKKYKIVKKRQFTYVPNTSRRGDKIGIAMLESHEVALVSPVYTVFEVIDTNELLPEYLMMWFRRSEFDRYARYMSHGSVRELFGWDEMCDMELPVPSTEKQREIVNEYHTIIDRIKLNEQLNQKLEETAQAIYKQWFVDFEFPDSDKKKVVESGHDDFELIPNGWEVLPLKEITSKIGSGSTPRGGKAAYKESGISLVRSLNVFDFNFAYEDLAFIDESQANKLDNVQIEEKDILINITGVSVARCCITPSSILPARVNQHVAILRPNTDSYLSHYLLCALCSTDYKARFLGISEGGSTRQALTKTDLEECLVLIPDLDTRKRFESLASKIFKLKHEIALENELLTQTLDLVLASIVSKIHNHQCEH